jgi:exopolysaccharide production protein ExoZ
LVASSPPEASRQIAVLQAGRALAALAVVALHAAASAQQHGGPALPQWIAAPVSFGGLGVDFFFVLSGFVMHYIGFAPVRFATSRFKRVFLPYWPIGLAVALAYTLFPGVSAGSREWLWLPTLTLLPLGEPALIVAWTLQYEIVFYFVYGVSRFLGHPILGVAALAAVSPFIGIDTVTVEFLFGVLACEAVKRGLKVWPLFIPAFALFCFFPTANELFGLAMAFLIGGLVQAEQAGKLRVSKSLAFLGDASYSIYLVHNPVCAIAARLVPNFAVLFVIGTVASVIYHLAVEKMLLGHYRRFKALGNRQPAPPPHASDRS